MSTTTMPDGCRYCGGYHAALCPRVAEIDYYPDGTVKRVRRHSLAPVTTFHTGTPRPLTATIAPPPTSTAGTNNIGWAAS